MEWILWWAVGTVLGGIGAFGLLPILAKGSVNSPLIPWVLLGVFGLAGACILTAGLAWTGRHLRLTSLSGKVAAGRVVDQRKEHVTLTFNNRAGQRNDLAFDNPKESSWVRYHPVVEFRPDGGDAVRFEGRVYGVARPMIPTGADVRIYYDPLRPSNAVIGSFAEAWLGPLVVTLAGAVCLAYGLLGFGSGRRAIAADVAAQLSPEAVERLLGEDAMAVYRYPSKVRGTICRI